MLRSRRISICLVFVLFMGILSIPERVYAKEEFYGKPTTTIIITDEITGKAESYQLGEEGMQTYVKTNSTGEKQIVTNFGVTKGVGIVPYTDSSSTDIFSGWKISVEITYTITDYTACLKEVWCRIDQVSGNASRGEFVLTYGQQLGTNSTNGYRNMYMSSLVKVPTLFSPGKYGYNRGYFLGANVSGKVAGKKVEVICNVTL